MKDVNILTGNGVNVQQSLELFGDMEMYDDTLKDFLDMVDEKLQSLEEKKTLGDMANYAIEVHALKSDAKYLGFTTLAELTYASELKSKAGDVMFVQENHPKILEETKRVIAISKQYLGIGGVQPQIAQPQVVQTQAIQPQTAQPQVVQPQVAQPQVAQPQTVQPQAVQPQAVQSQVVQPQAVQPQVVQPQVAQPQVVQPQIVSVPQTQSIVGTQPVQTVQPQVNSIDQSVMSSKSISGETIQFFPADSQPSNETIQFLPPDTGMVDNVPLVGADGKKGIILIIDDSMLIIKFVKKIFEKEYEVLVAQDGAAGIELADNDEIRKDVKACLLDLNMPNVNGFQVLEHFKQKGYFVKLPVAIETAAEDTESIEKANSYPVVDILTKPFNERDIKRVIEKCLATYF